MKDALHRGIRERTARAHLIALLRATWLQSGNGEDDWKLDAVVSDCPADAPGGHVASRHRDRAQAPRGGHPGRRHREEARQEGEELMR
eukprot:7500467-Pyramimonas_sp.AAC.1